MSNSISPQNTTAVLLAAGHGNRMLPLTATTPKPLLKVGGRSLIETHLLNLAKAGYKKIVINIAYLADQIPKALGNGSKYGVDILYSDESTSGALETAGGIKNALPLIESDPFITVNADIWTDFDFASLLEHPIDSGMLVMTDNPEHNPSGDFAIDNEGFLQIEGQKLTFSGIAIYRKSMFDDLEIGKQALAPVFRSLIRKQQLRGIKLNGEWYDIGTPERLNALDQRLLATKSD